MAYYESKVVKSDYIKKLPQISGAMIESVQMTAVHSKLEGVGKCKTCIPKTCTVETYVSTLT